MKFKLGGEQAGTSLQGYVTARYSHVVAAFGEPNAGSDEYKVSTSWVITFDDGTVATLYDYKDTSLYDDGLPTPEQFRFQSEQKPYEWHVGGRQSSKVVQMVQDILNATPEPVQQSSVAE